MTGKFPPQSRKGAVDHSEELSLKSPLDNKLQPGTLPSFSFSILLPMKTLASLVLLIGLLFESASFAATTVPTEPSIISVRGRIVRISIPAGFDRVTLQQYVVPRGAVAARSQDRWRTIDTKYPRGADTVITLRIATTLPRRFLRVFGNKAEPLAGSLLTGITSFLADPIEATTQLPPGGINGAASLNDTANFSNPSTNNSDTTPRTVAESDIWKVDGNRLYFFNDLRGLQVFDLAKPAAPALLGTLRLPGSGEQMYLLGGTHAVLLKRSAPFFMSNYFVVNPTRGLPVFTFPLATSTASTNAASNVSFAPSRVAVAPPANVGDAGEIIVADVRSGAPKEVARVPYEGWLAESRMVGSVLYLATNVNRAATDTKASEYGVQITAFDLADPAAPVQRDRIFLGGWANAVTATDRFFLVAKYSNDGGSWANNTIDLIDISSPDGAIKRAGQALVRGNVSSKFQMNIDGDVLAAVTQNWGAPDAGDPGDLTFRWTSHTEVQTFSIANPATPVALGSLRLAPGETVRATRFDGDRAYVVTFRQIDPLFVVDLKDPARPSVSGHVEAPGFSTYIEPLGDRLVTVGLLNWKPAVSLFDVSDPAAPKLLSQITLGAESGWASSEAVWNEKAFQVLPDDNLILLPVSSSGENSGWFTRVQLLDLFHDKIVKRGTIDHPFSPRRSTLVNQCVVAISPSRLVTVDATNRDRPVVKADLEIAWSVNRVFNVGRYLVQLGGSADWGDQRPPRLSVSPADDPDETLNSIELAKPPVRGATVKDGVLYIAQTDSNYFFNKDGARTTQPLIVSAYDLSNLPVLHLLGTATTQTTLEYGDLRPLWPSPGILVWAGAGGATWPGDVWPVTFASANLVSINRWYYAESTRLLGFDFTRPETPKFLSKIDAGSGEAWDLSDPFESNGVVLFSYKVAGARTYTDETPEQIAARMGRHFLLRVDYADPAAPVIDDTKINLPGCLTGVARAGKLLFTVGQNFDVATGAPKRGESALHVSAFDGAAAHLLDTLPLASRYAPVSIQGEMVFALDGQPASIWKSERVDLGGGIVHIADGAQGLWWGGGTWTENPKTSLLSAWRLDDAGKFTKLGEIEAAHDTSLHVFGSLVVTNGDARTLHLFDASDVAKLEKFGEFYFSGWVYPDLGEAAGGLDTGLWVPLGAYGVETVAAPAPAR